MVSINLPVVLRGANVGIYVSSKCHFIILDNYNTYVNGKKPHCLYKYFVVLLQFSCMLMQIPGGYRSPVILNIDLYGTNMFFSVNHKFNFYVNFNYFIRKDLPYNMGPSYK